MNTQNILKFYGSRLDIKLDSSEYYDYEIGKTEGDYNTEVLDFTTPITYSNLVFDSSCLIELFNDIKPLVFPIETHITIIDGDILSYNNVDLLTTESHDDIVLNASDACNLYFNRRPEKGWTLDFIFNRQGLDWSQGGIFYYVGALDEKYVENYGDNNLSFGFTNDGRISWQAIHYSGYCANPTGTTDDGYVSYTGNSYNNYILGLLSGNTQTFTGFTETYYLASGQTPTLCTTGLTGDFRVTIVFDRYNHYTDCDIDNEGGKNDLITGITVNNILGVISGQTSDETIVEVLNKKWADERDKRLGTLKIYLNGQTIYKIENWEEIIPSIRHFFSDIFETVYTTQTVYSFGGGTPRSGGVHYGLSEFNIKSLKYYEQPLDYLHVRHNFIMEKNQYNFLGCGINCVDEISKIGQGIILYEDSFFLTTENNENVYYLG